MTENSSDGRVPRVSGGELVAEKELRQLRQEQAEEGVPRRLTDEDVFALLDRVNTLIVGQEAEAEERRRLYESMKRIEDKVDEYEARMQRVNEKMRELSERTTPEEKQAAKDELGTTLQEAIQQQRAKSSQRRKTVKQRILDEERVLMAITEPHVIGIQGAKFEIKPNANGMARVPRTLAEEIQHMQAVRQMLEEQKRVLRGDESQYSVDEARRVDARLRQIAQKYGARPADESDMEAIEVIQ